MQMRRHDFLRSKGFTLIEVIIVIAILAIVAGAMAPLATRAIDNSRQDLTIQRQKMIYQAIMGDSSMPGTGFLSDVGRLPNNPPGSLVELSFKGSLPAYSSQTGGVGMGWRGSYILDGVDSAGNPIDGWGTPMVFQNGQIRSAGPDRNMNTAADNILYPSNSISANNLNGSVVLNVVVVDASYNPPQYVPAVGTATVYYANDGAERSFSFAGSGSYVCPNLPQGVHAIKVTGYPNGGNPLSALSQTITVYCPGGGTVHQTVALRN
jgi:prepilin-type N-terminal cleavage/methylation domain-containing protein